MARTYDAAAIEVLSGLDPVRKRPGMYTDTSHPNHLAYEVIDNSVDEAISGYASKIAVSLNKDGSILVSDDGRGMPVDKHPEYHIPGVELIMTRLHAGGKFSDKTYKFSGGLHGVGVSVVNALSSALEIWVRRSGKEYNMRFAAGEKTNSLTITRSVGQRNTGTTIQFWPDPKYFDVAKFAVPRLIHTLRAKAVLCPGLRVSFDDKISKNSYDWQYETGLESYLSEELTALRSMPDSPFIGNVANNDQSIDWALAWLPDDGGIVCESYVNLIPTGQGGTHVNGLRSGLTDAVKEFCDFQNLLPKGVRLTPDDVWENCNYVLSLKLTEPQFTGQTKDRLSSRECASLVSNVIKDSFGLWLSQHPDMGAQIAELAISNAQRRNRAAKKIERKKQISGPALPGKLAECSSHDLNFTELFLVEGDSAGGSAKQARDREFQAVMPLRGKILNTWEIDPNQVLASQEVHDISVAIGMDPGSDDMSSLRYGKLCILADADSDGAHIAALLCGLFVRHFQPLVEAGRVFVAMPPLFRIDAGKAVYYALDDHELRSVVELIKNKKQQGKINVQRFKGLGEMNPTQLRETTLHPDSRRLVQLTLQKGDDTLKVLDMLLAKKRAADRKKWLNNNGDLASLQN